MKDIKIRELHSDDFLKRCDAVEYLSQFINDEKISTKIQELFYDRNYLVRCEAYDAFYNSNSVSTMEPLLNRLQTERSQCARMHICSTINSIIKQNDISDDIKKRLLKLYMEEKSPKVLIAYYGTMYLLSKDVKYIEKALAALDDEDYHIRCNVVNILYDVIDNDNKKMIFDAYNKRLVHESSIAVKTLLEESLETIYTESHLFPGEIYQ